VPESPSPARSDLAASSPVLGAASLLAAAATFPLTGVAASRLGDSLSSAQISFLWCAASTLLLGGLYRAVGARILPRSPFLTLLRGLAGAATVLLFFESLRHVSLATSTALYFSHPVWVALFSFLAGKDRPRLVEIAAILVAVAGVVAVVDPIFGDPGLGELLALLSGAAGAAGTLCVRELRGRGESSATIAMGFFVVGSVVFAVPTFAAIRVPDAGDLLPLGLLVAAGTVANLAYAFGYRFVRAPTGGVIQTTEVVFAFGWGMLLLGQEPTTPTILGGAAIVASAAGLVFAAARARTPTGREG